jgi:hypothetical protein
MQWCAAIGGEHCTPVDPPWNVEFQSCVVGKVRDFSLQGARCRDLGP